MTRIWGERHWREGLALWVAAVPALALAMPPPRLAMLGLAALLSGVLITVGVAAREAVEFQPTQRSRAVRLIAAAVSGALLGGVLLALLVRLAALEPQLRTRYAQRAADPPWMPWLLALESAILEEVVFRVFLMSVTAWLIVRTTKTRSSHRVFVVALAVSTLAFGAAHVPAWLAVARGSLFLVAAVVGLNGIAGVLLGWVYWRWGILSAVVCHFAGDVVVQTFAPRLLM